MQGSEWQTASLQQTPTDLWAHKSELTAYQVWVVYRVAVRQLNLFHPGRVSDNSCRKLQCCQGVTETMEHICWTCPCAQACWLQLICHWTGERWTLGQLRHFLANCASRRAPELSKVVQERLTRHHPDEVDAYAAVWKRIWRILSSICITSLWIQRNRVTFQRAQVTIANSVNEFWTTSMRQLRAVAKRDSRRPDTKLDGTRLMLCQRVIASEPREPSPQVTSPYNYRTRLRNRRC